MIQHAEPTDGKGEDVRKFLEPMFDPGFTVVGLVPEQEGASDAASDAVVSA